MAAFHSQPLSIVMAGLKSRCELPRLYSWLADFLSRKASHQYGKGIPLVGDGHFQVKGSAVINLG